MSSLSTSAQSNVRRVLDGAARRLLDAALTAHNDDTPAANGRVGKTAVTTRHAE
jgi:hypothetical protein